MTGVAYQWRPGTRIPIDAQSAGNAIEALRVRSGGQVTPEQVVAAARTKRSVLHDAFEWDDTAAAASYREHQARHLIGALVVIETPADTPREIRAFVSVISGQGPGYTALGVAMSDAELRAQVVATALRELQQWRERYQGYVELAAVHEALRRAMVRRRG